MKINIKIKWSAILTALSLFMPFRIEDIAIVLGYPFAYVHLYKYMFLENKPDFFLKYISINILSLAINILLFYVVICILEKIYIFFKKYANMDS